MRNVLVSFAEGDFYEKKRKLNSITAKLFGGIDYIYKYSSKDIDTPFLEKNKLIFENKKGCGFWLWKPYFVNKVLHYLNDNDILFYCDTSSVLIKNIKSMVRELKDSNQDIMSFELPLLECDWTKPSALSYFGISENSIKSTNQITASFFIIRKTSRSIEFVNEWLELCQNKELIDDSYPSDIIIPKNFKGHRNDQSIFSLLIKKYKIKPFRDPSQYGEFPEMYRMHSEIHNFNILNSNYKTSIILVRKGNIIFDLIKYYIKKTIKRFYPNLYIKMINK